MTAVPYESSPARARSGVDLKPYLIGVGIGVLSWAAFVVANAPLGITTSLAQVSGGVASLVVGPEAVAKNSYWAKNALALDYGTLFLVGTLIGGFLSALTSRSLRVETVPTVWAERFGPSPMKRYVWAIVGGAVAMYGARMANGCTSGNGISGGLQLALSGWVFLAAMFVSGIVTAQLVLRKR